MSTATPSNLALKMINVLEVGGSGVGVGGEGTLERQKSSMHFFLRSQGTLSSREFAALSGRPGVFIYH